MLSKSDKSEVCLSFGQTIRRLRHALELSQESLADRAKIHRTYIGGIERGERNPTLTMIVRLAQALSVPPAMLLKVEGTEKSESADEGR